MAIEESLKGHARSEGNPADLLTKVVTEKMRIYLVALLLYHIFDVESSNLNCRIRADNGDSQMAQSA